MTVIELILSLAVAFLSGLLTDKALRSFQPRRWMLILIAGVSGGVSFWALTHKTPDFFAAAVLAGVFTEAFFWLLSKPVR